MSIAFPGRRLFACAVVILALSTAAYPGASSHSADSHSSGSHSGSHSFSSHNTDSHRSSGHHSSPSTRHGGTKAAPGVKRDNHGKIARSGKAKTDFKRTHPCPSTGKRSGSCPGYVIDHVTPLKRGGADAPGNMQWQTTQAAKIKDRTE